MKGPRASLNGSHYVVLTSQPDLDRVGHLLEVRLKFIARQVVPRGNKREAVFIRLRGACPLR
jgi:hypothetical protein